MTVWVKYSSQTLLGILVDGSQPKFTQARSACIMDLHCNMSVS